MDKMVRKHVERAQRVADFAREYPSDLPGYQAALERIEERLARATEVAQEEVGSVRAEQEELLVRYGLPAEQLVQLSAGLDRFAGLLGKREAASRSHVGDRQQLRTLARDLKLVVDQMHTINRYRFRKDRALMAMWQAARDLRVGFRKPEPAEPASVSLLALPPGSSENRSAA